MNSSLFDLTGKTAIVTGAGRGIGKAIASGFAQAGANVVVVARTTTEIEEVAAKIRDEGGKALAITTDVQSVNQVTNMLHKTLDSFGRIDILVNNAGGGSPPVQVLDMDLDEWEAVLKFNLDSFFICSKTVGEVMVQQRAGNIINMGSVAGLGPFPGNAAYGVAKAGIINLTKTLAVEWAPYNIRINAIAPGFIDTPGLSGMENVVRQAILGNIPQGRFGKPEDIVGVAIYLASDASAYVTGATFIVNGGLITAVPAITDK